MNDENKRNQLNTALIEILGSNNVYFQPPSNVTFSYPCIKYERSGMNSEAANNQKYKRSVSYTVMYIDKEPDSPVLETLHMLVNCAFDRHYVADGLNHDVFKITI
jgi:hypothetical protein